MTESLRSVGAWLGVVEQKEPQGYLDRINSAFQLPYAQRTIAFAITIGVGALFVVASTYMIFLPRTFGKYYTIGSVLMVFSTVFLVGPIRMVQSMFHPSRVWASVTYLLTIVLTLWAALKLQSSILTMFMVIIQLAAAAWYGASYIPFCQSLLWGTASTILPL